MSRLMPAFFSCACTASIRVCMPVSVVWMVLIVTPFGYPASASNAFALAKSYGNSGAFGSVPR